MARTLEDLGLKAVQQLVMGELEEDVALELAGSDDQDVRTWLASSPHTSESTQWALAKDDRARRYLALNRNLHPRVQEELARSPDWQVRGALAANRSATPGVQQHLAGDPDPGVRSALAGNPAATPGVQGVLAGDKEANVHEALGRNENLVLDEGFPVRCYLSRHVHYLERVRSSRGLETQTWDVLAANWEGSVGELAEAALLLEE